jgi:hypothetical protein
MVRQWLAGEPLEEFLLKDFGRAPRMGLATAWGAAPLLDWGVVAGLLRSGAPVRLGKEGAKWAGLPPRSMLEAYKLMREGWGLLLHDADSFDEPLRRLGQAVRRDIGGRVGVEVSVHPRGHAGFGWRRADEHLFLVQSCGAKTVFFRDRVSGAPRAWRLTPGDWIHVPAGWPYACRAESDSLTLRLRSTPYTLRLSAYSPLASRSSSDTKVKPRERMESTSSSMRSSPPSVAAS